MQDIAQYILWFFIYSFLGWVVEMTVASVWERRYLNRGFVLGPFCPVYGIGAISVLLLLSQFSRWPLAIFALSIVIASLVEYVAHWVLEKTFAMRLWDYSGKWMNLNGRICLVNSIWFGILSLAVVYAIHPYVVDITDSLPSAAVYISAAVITLWYVVDFINTVIATYRLGKGVQKFGSPTEFVGSITKRIGKYRKGFRKTILQMQRSTVRRLIKSYPKLQKSAKKRRR